MGPLYHALILINDRIIMDAPIEAYRHRQYLKSNAFGKHEMKTEQNSE